MDRERTMNLASINALLIILTVSLTTSSSGFFQAASAFIQITSPSKNEEVPAGSTLEHQMIIRSSIVKSKSW
jgi:hypothetical protein